MAIVAWPPPTPPNNRANATPQLDSHPTDHNRIADALDTLIDRADMTGPWQAAPLNANFTNFGQGYTPACYRVVGRTGRQWVQLSAMLVSAITPATNQQIIALPGLVPVYNHLFRATTASVANGAPNGVGDVRVLSSGNVAWFGSIAGTPLAAGGWLTFEMWWPLGATV